MEIIKAYHGSQDTFNDLEKRVCRFLSTDKIRFWRPDFGYSRPEKLQTFMREKGLEKWDGSQVKSKPNFEMNSGVKFPGKQLSFYSEMKLSDFQKSK